MNRPNWAETVWKTENIKRIKQIFLLCGKWEALTRQHREKPQGNVVLTWLARRVPKYYYLSFIYMGFDILVMLHKHDSPQFCMGRTDVQKWLYLFNKYCVEKEMYCSGRVIWHGWDQGTAFLPPGFLLSKMCGFLSTLSLSLRGPSLQLEIWTFCFTEPSCFAPLKF